MSLLYPQFHFNAMKNENCSRSFARCTTVQQQQYEYNNTTVVVSSSSSIIVLVLVVQQRMIGCIIVRGTRLSACLAVLGNALEHVHNSTAEHASCYSPGPAVEYMVWVLGISLSTAGPTNP